MSWKRFTKPRFLFVYPLTVALFLFAHVTERSFRAGMILIILGELVRGWANGHVGHLKVNWTQKWRGDAKIGRLVTAGPYAFVRHPLYLGTLVIGAGFCLMVNNPWLTLAALAGFLSVYHRTMAQEEALLRDECSQEYLAYQAAVPRLVPRWHRYARRQGEWSWRGIAASKEWKTAIWIMVLAISVYFWEEWVQERGRLLEERHAYRLFLLTLLLLLIALDGFMEVLTRRMKAKARTGLQP